MNKSTDFAISTQKIIIGFQNTVKRFSSEYDFNNEKTDLYGSLLHLAQQSICNELQITNLITNTMNLLKSLNYDSSYRDLVVVMNGLSEIKYELNEFLDKLN